MELAVRGLSPRKSRKAQLAAFIMIGILILAMGGTIYYLISISKKTEAEQLVEKGMEVGLDKTKIGTYISACIEKEGQGLVDKLEFQGGTLNPANFRYYFNVRYNYHCIEQEGAGCVNRMVTRLSMAYEINFALKKNLKRCANFDNFRKQGYDVKEGQINAKTIIGVDDVSFEVIYPITITKDKDKVDLNDFSGKVSSKLGTLYDLATKIVYAESTEGRFDEDRWRLQHGQIVIEKHKPYPDTVYALKIRDAIAKKEESFNFAIGGRYTIYDIGKPTIQKTSPGYCRTKDNNCYANANQEDCVVAQGEWKGSGFQETQCGGMSAMPESECEGDECKGCGKRKNGESWCEYEGLTSPGLSLVGSRHYKGSCIDGKIYYTECRDYREEVCVENDQIEVPKAVCRINRWQDCAKQTSKESCTDNSERDCWWSGWLVAGDEERSIGEITETSTEVKIKRKTGKCIPYIPPGFAHWQMNGQEACAMANDQASCNSYTCGQAWVDSSAAYCYFMGDCGNYRNVAGEISKQGYFNFDVPVSDYVYLTEEQLKTESKPMLKMEADSVPELDGTEFNNPKGTLSTMMDKEVKYFDEVANWRFEDFRMNYLFEGKVHVHVVEMALCMPWQAPYKGKDCKACGGPNRPCTEYKCRSLGQTCTYEEVNGMGFCYDYADKDKTPPRLFFDGSVYGDFDIKPDIFGKIKGYKIDKPLPPYAPLFFILNATEPVKCKAVALPELKYDQILLPSSPTFENFYGYTDTVPKPTDFRIGLMKSIGINNFLEFGTIESYDKKFNRIVLDARRFVKEFQGAIDKDQAEKNIARVEKLWNDEFKPNLKKLFDMIGDTFRDIAIQSEQGNKIIFFKCVDKAGNEMQEDVFLKYTIGKDIYPPIVVAANPANNTNVSGNFSLVFYTHEPANCRIASADMEYGAMPLGSEIDCLTPSLIGSMRMYECDAGDIEAGAGKMTTLYIRCRDKPFKTIGFKFNLTNTDSMAHMDPVNMLSTALMEEQNRINLTTNWEEYIKLPEVKNINVKSGQTEIVINSVNDEFICRYSNGTVLAFERMQNMDCGKAGMKADSQCSKKFDVTQNTFINIVCARKSQEEERNTAKESTILSYSNLP